MLEQADRARRAAEQELQDGNESLSELNAQNQSLVTAKRRVEAEMDNLKQDVDDVASEARTAEDKAHRYTIKPQNDKMTCVTSPMGYSLSN